jgi:hypothetical protein
MADLKIPSTATQQEIRAEALICRNRLDADGLDKYALVIDRISEPQDAEGVRVGDRARLPSVNLPLSAIVAESYTIGGTTLTVPEILAFVNEVVDAHKGDGLTS